MDVAEDEYAPIGAPLEYIINHVFLPPKLPQSNDTTVENETALAKQLSESLLKFINLLPEEDQPDWNKLPPILDILLDDGRFGSPLRNLAQQLDEMEEGDAIALHITYQNAGVVFRRKSDQYTFESFELAATTKAVTGTIGRLIRRFPGPVIAIPPERVLDLKFRKALENCLISLEAKTPSDAIAKGPGTQDDTVHPQFATEWLPGILRGIGSPLVVSRIYKRTRDEVIWGAGEEPWRRSPRWTLLRVAL